MHLYSLSNNNLYSLIVQQYAFSSRAGAQRYRPWLPNASPVRVGAGRGSGGERRHDARPLAAADRPTTSSTSRGRHLVLLTKAQVNSLIRPVAHWLIAHASCLKLIHISFVFTIPHICVQISDIGSS